MSRIYVNGKTVDPAKFQEFMNDNSIHVVAIAPFKYQTHSKAELDNHPNLHAHLQSIGVLPPAPPANVITQIGPGLALTANIFDSVAPLDNQG